MFDELTVFIQDAQLRFSENVRDAFGQSFLEEVYEPILLEMAGLREMRSDFEVERGRIHELINQAREIT